MYIYLHSWQHVLSNDKEEHHIRASNTTLHTESLSKLGKRFMQIAISTKFGAMFVVSPHLHNSFSEAGKTTQTTHANELSYQCANHS